MSVKKGDQEIDGVLTARDIQFYLGKHGDMLYKHRQKWKKLHIGTVGQVLKVSASGFPVWGPGGGGGCQIATGSFQATGPSETKDIAVPFVPKHIWMWVPDDGGGEYAVVHFLETNDAMPAGSAMVENAPKTEHAPVALLGQSDPITITANGFTVTGEGNVGGTVYWTAWG